MSRTKTKTIWDQETAVDRSRAKWGKGQDRCNTKAYMRAHLEEMIEEDSVTNTHKSLDYDYGWCDVVSFW